MALSRRALLAASACLPLAPLPFASPAFAAGDRIRKLVIVAAAQASDPQEFQAAQLLAASWRQLGLEIEVRGLPRPQLSTWCGTIARVGHDHVAMVGRPDGHPDEPTTTCSTGPPRQWL